MGRDGPVLIVGAGLAGLAAAIALRRRGWAVCVFDKARVLRDAGSGMSVIGHSLALLLALGVDVRRLGTAQDDVRLTHWRGHTLFDVPLRTDAALVAAFGSVQFNVHRGELHQALLRVFEAEGGTVQTASRVRCVRAAAGIAEVELESGEFVRGSLVIGADGVHSVVRAVIPRLSPPRYSGYACWRGIAPAAAVPGLGSHMFKTIVQPAGRRVSFTSGTIPGGRRFWALDIVVPQGFALAPSSAAATRAFLLQHVHDFPPAVPALLLATLDADIVATEVWDATPWAPRCSDGPIVLLGDAAHPVVHHFGQGACMALEDAVALVQCLEREGTVGAAVLAYDSWAHWARCALLVMLSRITGALYTSGSSAAALLLSACLQWPFSLLFVLVIHLTLFVWARPLRAYAQSLARS